MNDKQIQSEAKSNAVVMFRADEIKQEPVKVECPSGLWHARDADGIQIYENTHFKTEKEAWQRIYDSAAAWVSLSGRSIAQAENTLLEARAEAGVAGKQFSMVTDKMRRAQT